MNLPQMIQDLNSPLSAFQQNTSCTTVARPNVKDVFLQPTRLRDLELHF